jgi:hypothetical protein
VNFPPEWLNVNSGNPKIPPLFILNVQVPSDFSSSFFTEVTDGPGWSLVLYFKLRQVRSEDNYYCCGTNSDIILH